MRQSVALFFLAAALCFHHVDAQTFLVRADFGSVAAFQGEKGVRAAVTDTASIGMGDSVILGSASQATVAFEENSRLIFKGPGALTMAGDSGAVYMSFDEGQLFLDRNHPAVFSVLTFWVKNYMFVASGTAAAFRVMKSGMPFAAVLEGRVLMQSPTGESVEVTAGRYSLAEPSGRIATGTLGSRIVSALNEWSGVTRGQTGYLANRSSNGAIDDEIVFSLQNRPAVPVVWSKASRNKPRPDRERKPEVSGRERLPKEPSAPAAMRAAAPAPEKKQTEAKNEAPPERKAPVAEKPTWEISAGSATVADQQWTRLSLGVDVPIWKFGVFFDIEAFIDPSGRFSGKGWRFADDAEYSEAVTRKIRYVRFGHEQDPVFVKIGGINNVTLGHGFVVDRFTNMLHYPDQKLFGGQLHLGNLTPIGLTVQAFGVDAQELRERDRGGMGAARIALCPLKTLDLPVVSGVSIGGTYAYDRNLYAPARKWKRTEGDRLVALFNDRGLLADTAIYRVLRDAGYDPEAAISRVAAENRAKNRVEPFGIIGGDLTVPVITTPLLSLDVYAQAALRNDSLHGWGLGAPGVALKVRRLKANLEYRHIDGRFASGFFGPYYLDERLIRNPDIRTKVDNLDDDTLDGLFGRLDFDLFSVLTIGGGYQYMVGSNRSSRDQRLELSGALGSMITERIPKVRSAEAYFYKTRIGVDITKYDSTGAVVLESGKPVYDRFFEKTPFMYFGYRIGIEIADGATLIGDFRFGWLRDGRGRLAPNNNITVETAFTF